MAVENFIVCACVRVCTVGVRDAVLGQGAEWGEEPYAHSFHNALQQRLSVVRQDSCRLCMCNIYTPA